MEVIILQDYLRCGGTEKQSIFFNKFFNENKFNSSIVVFRPGGILEKYEKIKNHYILQKKDFYFDWYCPGLINIIKKLNPKIILCMGTVANNYAFFIKYFFPNIKIITTVRTGKSLSWLYKKSLIKSDKIIVNCKWWKDELINNGFEETKIIVHYNPILIPNNKNIIKYNKENQSEEFIFICVQNFRKGKQHIELIKNFNNIPKTLKWKLWLLGDGENKALSQKIVKKLNLEEKIIFLGYKNNTFDFYKKAHAAVTFSKEDSFPNFIIEAQINHLPIIALNTKGTPEAFIPNQSGFLIEKTNKKDFINYCIFLIKNPNIAIKMGQKGYEYVKENFDLNKQGIKLLNYLKQL